MERGMDGGPQAADGLQARFWRQAALCEGKVLPGPGKMLRWGVPDGKRDPATGELAHDDLLMSAALCTVMEGEPVGRGVSVVIPPRDPLAGLPPVY